MPQIWKRDIDVSFRVHLVELNLYSNVGNGHDIIFLVSYFFREGTVKCHQFIMAGVPHYKATGLSYHLCKSLYNHYSLNSIVFLSSLQFCFLSLLSPIMGYILSDGKVTL